MMQESQIGARLHHSLENDDLYAALCARLAEHIVQSKALRPASAFIWFLLCVHWAA